MAIQPKKGKSRDFAIPDSWIGLNPNSKFVRCESWWTLFLKMACYGGIALAVFLAFNLFVALVVFIALGFPLIQLLQRIKSGLLGGSERK